jgi:hypothetical protein
VSNESPWAAVVNAAGAAGAAIASVYAVGSIVMSLRYEGFGLSGQGAVAVTPREVLLFAGARSLVIWAAVGFVITLVLRRLDEETARRFLRRIARPSGAAGLTVVVVVLVLALHVMWPLAVVLALLVLVKAAASWRGRPVLRVVAAAAAIAAVALSFEADRLRYQLDMSCVTLLEAAGGARVCGILVGQNERGIYIGVAPAAGDSAKRHALRFVPAEQVQTADSVKTPRRVIDEFAHVRRKPLVERLLGFRVQ